VLSPPSMMAVAIGLSFWLDIVIFLDFVVSRVERR
jgi:hypothetical protein